MMRKVIILLILMLTAGLCMGQTYSVTNTFSSGSPARASEVNQNFQDLVTACNQLRTDLDAILSSQWVNGTAGAIYYSDGNVGIGTATPESDFHVSGPARFDGAVLFNDANGQDGAKWGVYGWNDDLSFVLRNADFSFNSSLMVIQQDGNVGIGTSSPTAMLDVVGDIKVAGFQLGTSTTSGYVLTADASGVGSWQPSGGGGYWAPSGSDIYYSTGNVGIGTTTPIAHVHIKKYDASLLLDGDTGSHSQLHLYEDGLEQWSIIRNGADGNKLQINERVGADTTVMTFQQDGNVGIGTTSPTEKLHVQGGKIKIVAPDASGGLQIFEDTETNRLSFVTDGVAANVASIYNYGNSAYQDIQIGSNVSGQGLTVVGSSGNVGIGTLSPGTRLHVALDNGAMPTLSASTAAVFSKSFGATSDAAISIISGAGEWGTASVLFGDPYDEDAGRVSYYNNNTDPTIEYMSFAVNIAERMRIQANGNVGIGTTAPGHKLTIIDPTTPRLLIGNAQTGGDYGMIDYDGTNLSIFSGLVSADLRLQSVSSTGDVIMVANGSSGNVGIGTTSPNSKLAVVGLPAYADNAAAISGGLVAGDFYRTGGDPDLVCVVH